jgi:uncharacterized protein (DUF2336 family)
MRGSKEWVNHSCIQWDLELVPLGIARMSATPGNLTLLLDLAKETSSEKRRELLRRVTDVFLDAPEQRTETEAALFDEIFSAVAADLETQVRAQLSNRIADSSAPLRRTARRLALDTIEVARPVIERSKHLTEDDIIEVIREKSQDHMMAVTRRPDITERVSGKLVERGEDHVVASLLDNRTARIDRATFETIADRAQTSPVLHAPFVRNQRVPLDLLNSVYLKVENSLRRDIMRRFHGVAPEEVEAALKSSRDTLSSAYGALPDDYQTAKDHITKLERHSPLRPPTLVQFLRENRRTEFAILLARYADIDFAAAYRVIEAGDLDAVAMLCRGAGLDRPLFVTIAIILLGGDSGITRAVEFGQIFEQVPVAAAQRALRFWKVRQMGANAAA